MEILEMVQILDDWLFQCFIPDIPDAKCGMSEWFVNSVLWMRDILCLSGFRICDCETFFRTDVYGFGLHVSATHCR